MWSLKTLIGIRVNIQLIFDQHFVNIVLKDFLNLFFRERRQEEDREGEKHQCVVPSHMPPPGDLACNSGMCPDWESNRRPFGLQASTQSTEPGPFCEDFICSGQSSRQTKMLTQSLLLRNAILRGTRHANKLLLDDKVIATVKKKICTDSLVSKLVRCMDLPCALWLLEGQNICGLHQSSGVGIKIWKAQLSVGVESEAWRH